MSANDPKRTSAWHFPEAYLSRYDAVYLVRGSYEAARVHRGTRRRSGDAACGASATGGHGAGRDPGFGFPHSVLIACTYFGFEGNWLHRRTECTDRAALGRR